MKENIEDYRKEGFINLDEYLSNNPEGCTYPYYINGYSQKNFWTKVGKEDEEKFIYVKPRTYDYLANDFNVYAELIYEEYLKQIGLETASFDIANYNGSPSTISENILDNYGKNQFIISAQELFDGRKYIPYEDERSLEDLFNAIHEYCIYENIDRETESKIYTDISKVCIADIFAMTTDRKPTDFDFIAGIDDEGNNTFSLAPSCHNPYAFGSNFTRNEILDMLEDWNELDQRVNLCYSDCGVPEFKRDWDYPYWEDSLYYFIDEDDDSLDFALECVNKMDIDSCIRNVEKRIKARIPSEYKDFIHAAINSRGRRICEAMNLDYYKVMDREYEVEEI